MGQNQAPTKSEPRHSDDWLSLRMTYIFAMVLILIGSFVALHTIQWHEVTAIQDDTPTTYANLMRYPDRFENDFLSIYGIGSTWGTIINWGTGILWRDFDVPPQSSYFGLAVTQAIIIGSSVFLLTLQMTKSRGLALFSIPFIYVARVTQWNLSESWSLFPKVYSGDLSVYFLLFAFVLLLQERRWGVIVVLLIGSLIHPAITLYVCAIIGLYWLWELVKAKDQKLLIWISLLVGVGIFAVAPRFLLSGQAQGTIPQEALMDSIIRNMHFYPYERMAQGSSRSSLFIYWVALVLITKPHWKNFTPVVRRLLIATIMAATVLIASQFVGHVLNIIPLIQLVGGRASQFVVLLTVPVVLSYLLMLLRDDDWRVAVPSLVYLLWFLTFSWFPLNPRLYAPFLIFSFILIELARILQPLQKQLRLKRNLKGVSLVLFTLGIIFALFDFYQIYWSGDWIQPITVGIVIFFALIIIRRLTQSTTSLNPFRQRTFLVIAFIFFTAISYRNIYIYAQTLADGFQQDLRAAQIWARDNTPEDAVFAGIIEHWRPVSERSYIHIHPRPLFVYYLDERLYTAFQSTTEWLGSDSEFNYKERFYNRTEAEYLDIRNIAPIDYLVFETHRADKDFEVVYQNLHYTIYKLPEG